MFAELFSCLEKWMRPFEGFCSTLNPFSSGACLFATEHAAHPSQNVLISFYVASSDVNKRSTTTQLLCSESNSKEFHCVPSDGMPESGMERVQYLHVHTEMSVHIHKPLPRVEKSRKTLSDSKQRESYAAALKFSFPFLSRNRL
jgi:hypothetical protein